MSRICAVCAHPDLASINMRLFVGPNISAMAVEFGVPRKSMENHRNCHLRGFLAELTEQAARPRATAFQMEVHALYLATLEQLANAEVGVWQHVETTNATASPGRKTPTRPPSFTSIARSIQAARSRVTELVELVLTEPNEQEAEERRRGRELSEGIERQLRLINERREAASREAGPEA